MSRLKLLITNVGFFGGLKILSSLFPLLILPYIASKISTEEFGVYDIFTLVGGLMCSISMLGIQDAMFRQFHLKKDNVYRQKVVSTGILVVLFSTGIICVLGFLFKETIQQLLIQDEIYYNVILLSFLYVFLQNLMNLAVHPSRLENNKKDLLYSTILHAVIFYAVALVLIQYNFGLYSLVFAHFGVSVIIALFFLIINRKKIFPLKFNSKIAKSLLYIGIPLMPIFIIYWANNSIARILIAKYLSASELGVFAVGSKYAALSTFLQMAFAGGWSYFTFSTMKDHDQVELKSNIFNMLLIIIVIFYGLVVPFVPWFYELFFEGAYTRGYTVFNQLFLSPLFLMLYQIVANQFTIANKSYFSLIALGTGVGIGIAIAYYLAISGHGISSISYTIPLGYLLALLLASFLASKQKIFKIKSKMFVSILCIVLINIIAIYYQTGLIVSLSLVLFTLILYVFINKSELMKMVSMLKTLF